VALAGLCAVIAWRYPRQLLCVDSGLHNADAIVVLGGDTKGRPQHAAELFRQGRAPQLIVSGGEIYRQVLLKSGVPFGQIQLELASRSTKENAEFCLPLLRRMGARRVIVVTSWYHSRRALNCFRKMGPEMTFYSSPSYYGLRRSDWGQDGIGIHIRQEYVKTLAYWVRYGIRPF
jgi:uncharacterized SAM-binding protein YcdF (DUF218 family)